MSEERIEHLELKYAYQEQAINEMSDVIYKQQQKIDRLEQLLKMVMHKMKETDGGGAHFTSHADETPPHY